MLEAYAKEHGFVNLRHYTDDGWSGASFDRPAWNELVAGVKAEEITTVIVKDLSRVGRDHLQVGFFTDILFREKEVHFIAMGTALTATISKQRICAVPEHYERMVRPGYQ